MQLKDKPVLIGAALAALLLAVLIFGDSPESALLQRTVDRDPRRLSRGDLAPAFTLATARGDTLSLGQLRGGPAVLLFVSPTCPHCKKVKEALLAQSLPDLGRRLVLLTPGTGDLQGLPPEIQELETRTASLFPVLQDSAGTLFAAYGVEGVPTAVLLDAKGKVRALDRGEEGSLKLTGQLVAEVLSARP